MSQRLPLALAVSLVLPSVVNACSTAVLSPPTMPPRASPSIRQALANAAYPIEGAATGKVQLHDGQFEQAAAPGSAAKIEVRLGTAEAFGDVNGDGTEDAAVTLVADFGGSGTFTYLSLVLNEAGAVRSLPAVLLGDRIIVNSLAIHDGSVVVDMLTRRTDEPMSDTPTVAVTRTFTLRGERLMETN
jgi:hypothetical protein